MSSAAATTVVIAAAAEQKKLLDRLKAEGALKAADAVAIKPEGKGEAHNLKLLHKAGFIGRTAGGHYWLTEKGLARQEAKPPSAGKVLLIILVVTMFALAAVGLALAFD